MAEMVRSLTARLLRAGSQARFRGVSRERRSSPSPVRSRRLAAVTAAIGLGLALATVQGLPAAPAKAGPAAGRGFPNVLLVTVDTLRADRLSAYGYSRPTSPNLDRLLARGARFTASRTPEPLTGPALCSLLTSQYPHRHGATRNGLRMRSGLPSLPRLLATGGYRTAAFVGNWTLRDRFTRLAEHFDTYQEVFSRKRWLGLFNREATGEDLTAEALAWLREHRSREGRRPFLAWVHYVEPHAPYRFQKELAPQLGLPLDGTPSRADRYDTEIAFIDREIGRLFSGLAELGLEKDLMVIFTADHGESLGEHDYWGHGRHVYEPTLRVPMGIAWPGRIPAGFTFDQPALLLDLAPTVLGLLGLESPDVFQGQDWSGALTGGQPPDAGRITYFQAHRGAVHGDGDKQRARERGLLEVAVIQDGKKELLRVKGGNWIHRRFDLKADPAELAERMPPGSEPSPELLAWLQEVLQGLQNLHDLDDEDAELDAESIERLKALGYLD